MAKGKKKAANKAENKKSDNVNMVMIDRKRVENAGYFNAMMGGLNDAKGIMDGMINDVTKEKAIKIEISMVDVEYKEDPKDDKKGTITDVDPKDKESTSSKSGEDGDDKHDSDANDMEGIEDVDDPFQGVEEGQDDNTDEEEKIDPDQKE